MLERLILFSDISLKSEIKKLVLCRIFCLEKPLEKVLINNSEDLKSLF